MNSWTSNYAIMRDLYKAQGHVDTKTESTIGVDIAANEKPPQLASEETEEDLYMYARGDADFSSAPDYGVIKQMLDMVRGDDASESNVSNDMIQISKTNNPGDTSKAPDFPDNEKSINNGDPQNKPRKKLRENVAIKSLLSQIKQRNSELGKLLIISSKVTESVGKVDEWFAGKKDRQIKNKPSVNIVGPTMFKKKSLPGKSATYVNNGAKQHSSQCAKTETYKPSSHAQEYYKKYLEKAKMNELIYEDIWQKAERLMKEADLRRAQAAQTAIDPQLEQAALESEKNSDDTDDNSAYCKVALTEPRHGGSTDAECVVCSVVSQRYRMECAQPIVEEEVLEPVGSKREAAIASSAASPSS